MPSRPSSDRHRLVTPAQFDRIREITDSFGLDWDQVVIPLVGAISGMEMLMPDGKLLVRPPAGPDFDPWYAGLAERLANMDLSRVKRQPLV